MFLSKDIPTEHEHIEPPNADLTLIRQYAQRDVKSEEVYCGALHACNTRVDRAGERFTKAYLERFRETLPGKPMLEGHDYGKRPVGRIYKTEVHPTDDGGHFLKAFYYVRADSPLVNEIELGIAKDVSIGYQAHRRVCDLDGKEWHPYRSGKDYCEHSPLEEYDGQTCTLTYCDTVAHKAEGMEMSWVWVGCQRGAEAIAKSFDTREVAFLKDLYQRLHGADPSGQGDPKVKTLEEVQQELLETKDAHQKALGDVQKQLQELKAQAADGEWGRGFLKTEIARFAGLLEMSDTYAVVLDNLKDAPCEKLVPLYEELGRKVDSKFSKGVAHTDGAPDPKDTQTKEPGGAWRRRRLVAR